MSNRIEEWCRQHIGQVLEVTNVKDFGMIELWDDRAIQVESNTGIPVASCKDRKRRVQLMPRKGANEKLIHPAGREGGA